MMIKRHTGPIPPSRSRAASPSGKATIHVSNVMMVTSGGVPTRVGYHDGQVGGGVTRRPAWRARPAKRLDKK